MIHITCTSCHRTLSVDDAFVGGVCRCQFCGTIQTVPTKASLQKTAAPGKTAAKTLFENKSRGSGAATGSGLDDLGDIVASSGLADGRLRKKTAAGPTNLLRILAIAAGIIIVLLLIVLLLVLRHPSNSPNNAANSSADSSTAAPTGAVKPPSSPNFCGTLIDGQIVVYLVDNGASSDPVLDAVKLALFKSINSLGPDRRFQILFWNPASDTYPTGVQTAFAVQDNVDAAQNKLKDVMAQGSTDPLPSFKNALADDPSEIILITAKAGDLDDSLVNQVLQLRGPSTAKIDCFAINGVPGDSVLAKISEKTQGHFVVLPESQLSAYAN